VLYTPMGIQGAEGPLRHLLFKVYRFDDKVIVWGLARLEPAPNDPRIHVPMARFTLSRRKGAYEAEKDAGRRL